MSSKNKDNQLVNRTTFLVINFYDNNVNRDNGDNRGDGTTGGNGSTSYQTKYIARYCLTDSSPHASNPGTVSRVTTASLSTAFQAGHTNCKIVIVRLQDSQSERAK